MNAVYLGLRWYFNPDIQSLTVPPTPTIPTTALSLMPARDRRPSWPEDNFTATLTGLPYHNPAIDNTLSASILSYSQQQARAVFTALFTCFIVTFAAFLLQCMQRFAREYDKCLVAKSQRRRRTKKVIRAISRNRKIFTGRGVLPWDDTLYTSKSPEKENTPFTKQSVNGSLDGRKSSYGSSIFQSTRSRNSARSRRPTLENVVHANPQPDSDHANEGFRDDSKYSPFELGMESRMWRSSIHTVSMTLKLYLFLVAASQSWHMFCCAIMGTFVGHWCCNGDFQEWVVWQGQLKRLVQKKDSEMDDGEPAKDLQVEMGGSGGTRDSQMTEGDIVRRHWSGGESDLIH